jgi:hypothetical protein
MKVQISGIKSLKEYSTEVNLSSATIITGQNSAGKSAFSYGLNLLSANLIDKRIEKIQELTSLELKNLDSNHLSEFSYNLNSKYVKYKFSDFTDLNFQAEYEFELIEEKLVPINYTLTQDGNIIFHLKFNNNSCFHDFSVGSLSSNFKECLLGVIDFAIQLYKNKEIRYLIEDLINKKSISEKYVRLKHWIEEENIAFKLDNQEDSIHMLIILLTNFTLVDFKEFRSFITNSYLDLETLKLQNLEFNTKFKDKLITDFHKLRIDDLIRNGAMRNDFFNFEIAIEGFLTGKIQDLENDPDYGEDYKLYFLNSKTSSITEYPYWDDEQNIHGFDKINEIKKTSVLFKYYKFIFGYFEDIFIGPLQNMKKFRFLLNNENNKELFFTKNSELYVMLNYFDKNKDLAILKNTLSSYNLAEDIMIEKQLDGFCFSIKVKQSKNSQYVNLASIGSGHYYFITFILKIYYEYFKRQEYLNTVFSSGYTEDLEELIRSESEFTFILTEPETNLHPNLQTILFTLICKIIKGLKFNFIIETHSEYIIRAIQLLIAKKVISENEIRLYYFENPEAKGTNIKRIRIDRNGFLLDKFSSGFLDETEKAIEELFKLKHN